MIIRTETTFVRRLPSELAQLAYVIPVGWIEAATGKRLESESVETNLMHHFRSVGVSVLYVETANIGGEPPQYRSQPASGPSREFIHAQASANSLTTRDGFGWHAKVSQHG